MDAPKIVLTAEEKKILLDSFREAFGEQGSEKRERVVKEMAHSVGRMLRQEYKRHRGAWWLWTLGKPIRPLTRDEIIDAKLETGRGGSTT